MGMDAKACLWVGFRSEDGDFSDLVALMPESYGDFELQTIECSVAEFLLRAEKSVASKRKRKRNAKR